MSSLLDLVSLELRQTSTRPLPWAHRLVRSAHKLLARHERINKLMNSNSRQLPSRFKC